MAFPPPMSPQGPAPTGGPAAAAPAIKPKYKTLAQVSAMGAATAPPGSMPTGPASDAPQPQNPTPQPPPVQAAAPPAGPPVPARPVVAAHGAVKSVGTHASRSPNKRFNAPHGMVQGAGPAPAKPVGKAPPQFGKKAPPFGK